MVLSTWGQGIEAIPSAAHVCLCVYKFSARKFGNEGQKKERTFIPSLALFKVANCDLKDFIIPCRVQGFL